MYDEGILYLIGIIILIFNLALFFKIWQMTNDMKGIHRLLFVKEALKRKPSDALEQAMDKTIVDEIERMS